MEMVGTREVAASYQEMKGDSARKAVLSRLAPPDLPGSPGPTPSTTPINLCALRMRSGDR